MYPSLMLSLPAAPLRWRGLHGTFTYLQLLTWLRTQKREQERVRERLDAILADGPEALVGGPGVGKEGGGGGREARGGEGVAQRPDGWWAPWGGGGGEEERGEEGGREEKPCV
jgi:hypothetical protein